MSSGLPCVSFRKKSETRIEITVNTMTDVLGVELPEQPPFAHFVDRQDVVNGLPI